MAETRSGCDPDRGLPDRRLGVLGADLPDRPPLIDRAVIPAASIEGVTLIA
jgi:hypothetical protein